MSQRFKSSPCIGFCSTTYGDMICRGCYRNLHEVLSWSRLSVEDKQAFYDKISHLAERELSKLIEITDSALVQTWLSELLLYCQDPEKRAVFYDLLQALQQGVNIIAASSGACQATTSLNVRDIYRQVDHAIYAALSENGKP